MPVAVVAVEGAEAALRGGDNTEKAQTDGRVHVNATPVQQTLGPTGRQAHRDLSKQPASECQAHREGGMDWLRDGSRGRGKGERRQNRLLCGHVDCRTRSGWAGPGRHCPAAVNDGCQ